jgi:hypothetical protein
MHITIEAERTWLMILVQIEQNRAALQQVAP